MSATDATPGDHLFALIARVSDGAVDWCDDARRLLGELRAEVLAEAGLLPMADVVAWLTKQARESTPVWQLASKVDRGAVRPNNLRMLPADFFEPGHTYTCAGWTFRCDAVTPDPDGGERTAIGWTRIGDSGWTTHSHTEAHWATGDWTDITAPSTTPEEGDHS